MTLLGPRRMVTATMAMTEASSEGDPTAQLALAARLRAAVLPLSRSIRGRTADGLTATEASVLGVIDRMGPIGMSDLAATERLSLTMISKAVGTLDRHGLVERTRAAHDARIHLVASSERGRSRLAETSRIRDQALADHLGGLTASERRALERAAAVLERLVTHGP